MFTKAFAIGALVLASCLEVNAHAAVSPVLGLAGAPARSDVNRPNTRAPCGRNVDIATAMAASTPVQAAADGTFTMTVTNFNKRLDGSRKMTGTLDTTATGDSFNGQVTMVQNGQTAPPELGSEQIVASLPAGTTCTGGAAGDQCLVSFKSVSGFGNCVVVQQAGAAGAAAAASTAAATGVAADTATATGTAATDATGAADTGAAAAVPAAPATPAASKAGAGAGAGGLAKLKDLFGRDNIGGTRAARAFLEALEELGAREDTLDLMERDMME